MSDERKIARNGRLVAIIMGQQLGYATSVRSCQAVEDRDTLVWRKRYRGTRHSRYQERGKRLATLCINTALACPHRDRAPERRHAQRYRSWNQPRSTKRKTCRSKFSLWWQCHLFYQQDSASSGPCTHGMGSCCAVPWIVDSRI